MRKRSIFILANMALMLSACTTQNPIDPQIYGMPQSQFERLTLAQQMQVKNFHNQLVQKQTLTGQQVANQTSNHVQKIYITSKGKGQTSTATIVGSTTGNPDLGNSANPDLSSGNPDIDSRNTTTQTATSAIAQALPSQNLGFSDGHSTTHTSSTTSSSSSGGTTTSSNTFGGTTATRTITTENSSSSTASHSNTTGSSFGVNANTADIAAAAASLIGNS